MRASRRRSRGTIAPRSLLALLVVSLLVLTGCTGRTKLRGPDPKVNQSFRTETVLVMDNGQVEIDSTNARTNRGRRYAPPGTPEPVRGTYSMREATTLDVTFLAVDGRQVVERRVKVVSDESRHTMSFDGSPEEDWTQGPLVGRTVLQRFADGFTKSTLEGEVPTLEQETALAELDPIVNDDEVYPRRSVKPGFAWTITDQAVLQRILGDRRTKVTKGSMAMTFERLVSFQVQPCALIRTVIDMDGSMPGDDGTDVGIKLKTEGLSHRSLESGHDLSETASGSLALSRTIRVDGTPVRVKIVGPITVESTTRPL